MTTETPLARMLADQRPRPDALAAFRIARRAFLAGKRLEMQALAAELGVSRATVFRWVGGRDQLIAEVIWSVTTPTLASAAASAEGLRGGERIASIMENYAALVLASAPFKVFVQRDPERTLRLLTTHATMFQSRLVTAIEAFLRDEIDAGHIDPPLPLHDLSYLILRICESFVYADVIAGGTPDPVKVGQAVGALLRTRPEG